LLLSGGSGITPMRAMLLDLQARAYDGDLVLLHVCRGPDDFIYLRELQDIARRFPALRLLTHFSARAGRLSTAALQLAVPDLAQRETWLCGPAGMMEMVQRLWQAPAHAHDAMPLHSERFAALPLRPASAPGAPVAVHLAASGQTFTTSGDQPLLVQAERAGLTPKHGCRIGICRSCQCTKKSGTVENLQTGDISSQPNEQIRLCISAARSDITLDL
jgi:ferredoxin-NADP reductase